MTTLETSLNTAHKFQRKADVLLKSGKYKEAVMCHQKAADFLSEALSATQSQRAKESLQLQRDYHLRQQAVVQYKQQRFEALKKAQEKNRTYGIKSGENYPFPSPMAERTKESIEQAVCKLLAERDSLLGHLLSEMRIQPNDKTDDLQTSRNLEDIIRSGIKFPKDAQLIIEEQNVKNEELKKLVRYLLSENERLQQRVEELEHYIAGYSGRRLTLIPDGESPYACSPFSDLSPGLRDLPQLAPLELPKFDFNSMKSTK